MKYYDISLPLKTGMVVWAGDTKFFRKESRGTAIVSRITMSSHTGTHIDAPKHFIFKAGTVDEIAIPKLIGKCRIIEIRPLPLAVPSPGPGRGRERSEPKNQIKLSDIKRFNIKAGEKILFKTRNGELAPKKKFEKNYVSLSLPAAKVLAQKKIDLVGIDYLGIEAKGSPGHPVHKTLLRAGIVIVEGLDLRKVKPGHYNLVVLPLKLVGGDGSPVRAILWT